MGLTETKKRKIKDLIGECKLCGSTENLELHRIKRKGEYYINNLYVLCDNCHREIHGKEKGTVNR